MNNAPCSIVALAASLGTDASLCVSLSIGYPGVKRLYFVVKQRDVPELEKVVLLSLFAFHFCTFCYANILYYKCSVHV